MKRSQLVLIAVGAIVTSALIPLLHGCSGGGRGAKQSSGTNPTPSVSPTPTTRPTPGGTPSPTPTITPSLQPSPTPTPTPTPTPRPMPTPTLTPTPTPTPLPTPTPTPALPHGPGSGNLLILAGRDTNECKVIEVNSTGRFVRYFEPSVPYQDPNGFSRDVTMDSEGLVYVQGGYFTPYVIVPNSLHGQTQYSSSQIWAVHHHPYRNGVVSWKGYRYSLSHRLSPEYGTGGFIRWPASWHTGDTFHTDTNYTQLCIGLDGLLYAIAWDIPSGRSDTVHVFDPETMERKRTIALPANMQSIAVDRNGHLYTTSADNRVYHLTSDGATVKTLAVEARLYDINISRKGELAMGGLGTFYYRTTTELNGIQTFDLRDLPNILGHLGPHIFVSFIDDEP